MLAFFRPTRYKLAYLLEWLLYLAFEAVLTRFAVFQYWLAALLPFVFLYLCGCILSALRPNPQKTGLAALLGFALGFGLLDQAAKWAVSQAFAPGNGVVLIPGGLSINRTHNLELSWLLNRFDLTGVGAGWIIALTVICLALVIAYYRQYRSAQRKSRWADLAFVFMAGGLISALCDQALVGWTVDFISLPGLFAADLKDIYLYLAVGSLLAEAIDNPATHWNEHLTAALERIHKYTQVPPRG
jgi:lipoprotein signal peptidase